MGAFFGPFFACFGPKITLFWGTAGVFRAPKGPKKVTPSVTYFGPFSIDSYKKKDEIPDWFRKINTIENQKQLFEVSSSSPAVSCAAFDAGGGFTAVDANRRAPGIRVVGTLCTNANEYALEDEKARAESMDDAMLNFIVVLGS